jgi:hypothetical protein
VMVRADGAPVPGPSEPGVAFAARVTHAAVAAGRLIATRELRGDGSPPEETGRRWHTAAIKGGRARAGYLLRSARPLQWPDRVRVAGWIVINASRGARWRVRRLVRARR